MACCICLDASSKKNPLQLLDCGCKVSLFHKSCEEQWLNQLKDVPKCPICKRFVQLTYNYSFLYSAGEDQLYFNIIALLYVLELLIYVSLNRYIEPIQSTIIIVLPCIIPSHRDIIFYFKNYHTHIILKVIYIYASLSVLSKTTLDIIRLNNCLHILYLCFFTNFGPERPNPLMPFAISSTIKHAHILDADKDA